MDPSIGPRPHWKDSNAFIMACVSAGAGYGSVFRFPYMCYLHGGSPFFIAYVVVLILIGWPMLIVELCVGQHLQKGCLQSFVAVHPKLEGLAIACIAIGTGAIASYYAVVLSWSEHYIAGTVQSPIPWGSGNTSVAINYFHNKVVESTNGAEEFTWSVCVGLVVLYGFVWVSVWKGISTLQYSLYFTFMPFVALLFMLTMVGLVLPRSSVGLERLFSPRTEFFSFELWMDAVGQVLISLALGCGTMVTFGSYNPVNHNTVKHGSLVVVSQLALSLCCGICTYSVLGDVNTEDLRVTNVGMSKGLSLPFVVYPILLAKLPVPQFFGFVFFCWLFVLGVGAVGAPVQAVYGVMKDKYPTIPHFALSGLICLGGLILGLPFCFGKGYYLALSIDLVVVGMCLPLHVFFECIGIGFMWGDRSIYDEVRERGHKGVRKGLDYCELMLHHGVGKLRDVLGAVDKLNVDPYVFPTLVKFVIPITCLFTVASTVSSLKTLYESLSGMPLWPIVVATTLPCCSVLIVAVFWVRAPPRAAQPVPWSSTMLSVEMQYSSSNTIAVA
eukprot:PhF_6_TR848/c0_g1_i1/m.1275/K05039/SLC6A6S; solute carrier family 6 (neurotransmitter transporter, GABA) member 6/8/11/12/13